MTAEEAEIHSTGLLLRPCQYNEISASARNKNSSSAGSRCFPAAPELGAERGGDDAERGFWHLAGSVPCSELFPKLSQLLLAVTPS